MGELRTILGHGHPRQANCTSLTLAEWLCRTADRIDPTQVSGSCGDLGRGTSAPDSKIIRRLLQLRQNASVFAQGCADFSSDSSDRNHSFTPDPRRASPSFTSGFKFSVHTGAVTDDFPANNDAAISKLEDTVRELENRYETLIKKLSN